MKKNNIFRLANFIEKSKFRFDMESNLAASRKHAGCIAGFAAALWPECKDYFGRCDIAREKLGISRKLGCRLFYAIGGQSFDFPLRFITRECAVDCLRNLARTGKVRFLKSLMKGKDEKA